MYKIKGKKVKNKKTLNHNLYIEISRQKSLQVYIVHISYCNNIDYQIVTIALFKNAN
jgi:hypothetical protein